MLGKRLTELRKEMRLTQNEIAERLHMSRSTYAQYEVDRRVPEYATLQKMADFFDVSIDYLVGRTNERKKRLYEPPAAATEMIIREIVDKYGVDLTNPGAKEKLEDIIKIIFTDYKSQLK